MDVKQELSTEIESALEDEEVFELGDASEETKAGWFGSKSEGGSWYIL